jgi:lysozyme
MDIDELTQELRLDEGVRLKPYTDTVGKLTIGIGRNLDDRGISDDEADYMLANDIRMVEAELNRNAPWWTDLPELAQRGLTNMCFNLGWPRLSGFRNMLQALQNGDYSRAADEALDSRWARQVGARAERIATQYRQSAGDSGTVGV